MASLQGSVGRGGRNLSQDVVLVQQMINQNLPDSVDVLTVDGIVGPKTIAAIEAFQRENVPNIRPDGRVDPGGPTFQALDGGPGPQPPAPPPLPPPPSPPPQPAPNANMKFTVAQFRAFSKDLEGEVMNMYLDTKNLVTIGMGNMIEPLANALTLPYVYKGGHPSAGLACSTADVTHDYNTVKGMTQFSQGGGGQKVFADATVCRITSDTLAKLVPQKLNANAAYMKAHYPQFFGQFDIWPADAQLGLMGMAWAMGPAFPLAPPPTGPWPKFNAACAAQDWKTAADECTMSKPVGTQITRNQRTQLLFRNAQAVKDGKGSPDVLQWPRDLSR